MAHSLSLILLPIRLYLKLFSFRTKENKAFRQKMQYIQILKPKELKLKDHSNLMIVPKYWCWTTGNFPRTSTLYILGIPLETFSQLAAPEMLWRIGEDS